VRALLDLMRENEATVHDLSGRCQGLLLEAARDLKILDPVHGEEGLIKVVAAALAQLSLALRKPQTVNPQPGILNIKP